MALSVEGTNLEQVVYKIVTVFKGTAMTLLDNVGEHVKEDGVDKAVKYLTCVPVITMDLNVWRSVTVGMVHGVTRRQENVQIKSVPLDMQSTQGVFHAKNARKVTLVIFVKENVIVKTVLAIK